jgi:pantetheine-phosphate adenylyltransferase
MNYKKNKGTIAVYPGTFDPITNGHCDLVRRILPLFEVIYIIVAENTRKQTLFSVEERLHFIRNLFGKNKKIKIASYHGLIVDLMKQLQASVIVRGLRAISDFEFEFQMALTNRRLNKKIETLFIMPDEQYTYLNSTMVKEVAQFGGEVQAFVSPIVAQALKNSLKKREISHT